MANVLDWPPPGEQKEERLSAVVREIEKIVDETDVDKVKSGTSRIRMWQKT